MRPNRRTILASLGLAATAGALLSRQGFAKEPEKLYLTDDQWKERLTPEQYRVLRKEGTERAGTSELNDEHRDGIFHCAGCDLPLFSSETKYESGTGWPSFWDHLPDALETKIDLKLGIPRKEYHCARCGGHQGHVFKDGPRPTGLRYCNNGVALAFVPGDMSDTMQDDM